MNRINILLPDDLHKAFAQRCAEGGVSAASVVRAIISAEVKKPKLTAHLSKISQEERQRIASARKAKAEARRLAIIRAVTVDQRRLDDVAAEFKITKSGVSKVLARAGIRL